VLYSPCANCAKRRIANPKAAIIHRNSAVDYKGNENAIAVVGRLKLNVTVFNKSVTAKVSVVKMELAVFL